MVLQRWWQRLKNAYHFGSASKLVTADLEAQKIIQANQPLIPGNQPLSAPVMVFDLETTGLNTRTDTVLSIGAVRVTPQGIALGQQFYQVLDIAVNLTGESQLIHGLTQRDLSQGCAPRQAILDFMIYGRHQVWLGFHAEFDRRMIKNATFQHLGLSIDPQPIDIAYLAPLFYPELDTEQATLNYWLDIFNLPILARHNAAADALATAELLLLLIPKAYELGYSTWGQLQQLCIKQRQLQRLLRSGRL